MEEDREEKEIRKKRATIHTLAWSGLLCCLPLTQSSGGENPVC